MRFRSVYLFCFSILLLQPAAAQEGGVPPEWEVRKNLGTLADGIERLKPILDQVRAEEWVEKGAPQAYLNQWKTTRTEVDYTGRSLEILVEQPGKLTAALDVFFRIDRLQALLNSLGDGIRKYQNAALADLLHSVVAEGSANREQLRQYIIDLAAEKERELKVVDEEAQRCRATLMQPAKGGRR